VSFLEVGFVGWREGRGLGEEDGEKRREGRGEEKRREGRI